MWVCFLCSQRLAKLAFQTMASGTPRPAMVCFGPDVDWLVAGDCWVDTSNKLVFDDNNRLTHARIATWRCVRSVDGLRDVDCDGQCVFRLIYIFAHLFSHVSTRLCCLPMSVGREFVSVSFGMLVLRFCFLSSFFESSFPLAGGGVLPRSRLDLFRFDCYSLVSSSLCCCLC
jgi:hypothetical protein